MRLEGPVLAATALDEAGDEAIRQAAEHAEAAGVPLLVIHVIPEIYGIRPLFPHLRETDRPHAEAARRWVLDAAEQQLRRVLPDEIRARELRIEAGSAHSMVLRVADEVRAGLLVVGSRSMEKGASLGGVAERIVRHAHCPVLVARRRMGSVVLAATDFSDPALPAIDAGHTEARRRGLELIVMHAVDIRVLHVESPLGTEASWLQHVLDAESERTKLMLKDVAARYGPDVKTMVRMGTPSDAILAAATELAADLVVMGTHGRSGLRRITLGSVAEGVVRGAACSVLVVRLST
jgi:nucleotide-binding universal stress UspA family protein